MKIKACLRVMNKVDVCFDNIVVPSDFATKELEDLLLILFNWMLPKVLLQSVFLPFVSDYHHH